MQLQKKTGVEVMPAASAVGNDTERPGTISAALVSTPSQAQNDL